MTGDYGLEERKFRRETITRDLSAFRSVTGKFEAELYPNTPLLDTLVELDVPAFAITWSNREKLMDDLAALLRKYAI